jgi:RNA polymerase sigma-70 factor, ECF subfamily
MPDLAELTDFELVDVVRAGNSDAYRHLVKRYEGKIYNLALRMLRQPEDAEDVLQETFVSAYRALPNFKGDSQFGTWLYRIATNYALMKLRGKKPVFVSLDDQRDDDSPPVELTDFSADPLADVLDDELRGKMEDAIGRLPADMRTVFLLRDVDGKSNSEVAEMLGLSVAAVKSRLHRTRQLLRKDLAKYFAERTGARNHGALKP